MNDIGPGDWVECAFLGDFPGQEGMHWNDDRLPTLGEIYVVSDAFIDGSGQPVILVGWERPECSAEWGYRCGFSIQRFRPIYRPKSSILRDLLQPAPSELEPA